MARDNSATSGNVIVAEASVAIFKSVPDILEAIALLVASR